MSKEEGNFLLQYCGIRIIVVAVNIVYCVKRYCFDKSVPKRSGKNSLQELLTLEPFWQRESDSSTIMILTQYNFERHNHKEIIFYPAHWECH